MELIHHDEVIVVLRQVLIKLRRVQGLNRHEKMIERFRLMAADPQVSEIELRYCAQLLVYIVLLYHAALLHTANILLLLQQKPYRRNLLPSQAQVFPPDQRNVPVLICWNTYFHTFIPCIRLSLVTHVDF